MIVFLLYLVCSYGIKLNVKITHLYAHIHKHRQMQSLSGSCPIHAVLLVRDKLYKEKPTFLSQCQKSQHKENLQAPLETK